jgi:hypothetical protein
VDPVPDSLLLIKSGSVGNRTRISGFLAWNSDHRGGPIEELLGSKVSDSSLESR